VPYGSESHTGNILRTHSYMYVLRDTSVYLKVARHRFLYNYFVKCASVSTLKNPVSFSCSKTCFFIYYIVPVVVGGNSA